MLVNATLIMWMNLSPYPYFCKIEKTKFQLILLKALKKSKDYTERFLLRLFDTLIISRKVERLCKIVFSLW